MQRQTLESALRAALKQRQPEPLDAKPMGAKPLDAEKASNILVLALRSSATDMDKIVQRRVGLYQKPGSSLK